MRARVGVCWFFSGGHLICGDDGIGNARDGKAVPGFEILRQFEHFGVASGIDDFGVAERGSIELHRIHPNEVLKLSPDLSDELVLAELGIHQVVERMIEREHGEARGRIDLVNAMAGECLAERFEVVLVVVDFMSR